MNGVEPDAATRVARLHAAVLTGRGPGASDQEIAEHTRDGPLLGAVPAPIERALVARQAAHLRAGEPIACAAARRAERRVRLRAGLAGAVTALLIRRLAARFVRARRRRSRW